MSSEETLSDGRVRGRVEEAEGRDLGVPSNILEREDGREPCFNPEEEVVGEVAGYETSLENRGSLAHLVENYGVPGRVLVRPAGNLLVWLLLEYGLGLTQLTPNAVRLVVAFAVYSRSRGVSFLTANVFKYFYVLNAGSGREKGWFYFTGRVVGRQRRGLFSPKPSSIKGWKDKFFFADDTEWDKTDAEVEHLSRWKTKGLNLNEYSLTSRELEDVGELEKGGVGSLDIMEYTSQRMLDAAEIYRPSSQLGEEMNKFLDAAGGAGILKKGRGKRGEARRRVEEGPIVAKRRRLEQQGAVVELEEVPAPATSTLRLEGTSSASAAEFAATLREHGYIRAQTTSFYDSGMRSTAKRFINTYFPEVDRQRAKDEVVARGSVGVVRQTLEAVNLVNALANEHHESLKERNQMRKENAELVKKSEAAEAEVAKLKAEMEELRKENATLKKDSENSYQKRKICEAELEKREKEVEEAGKVVAELELKVHNSVEEHVEGFLKSSTFEDIINLYRLPTAILAFSDCRKKVKLVYPDVDVTKVTFGEQEGEVEENGESYTADFRPEITLKWEKDSRGQTILPPKFSFEFVVVDEGDEGDEVTDGAEKSTRGVDQPTDNPVQPSAIPD
ncbi:hypothetical protein SLEP1_g32029 [Rubroshorea leprosula]|uniref:Uncharacterized protein n=1 Tax=Rubroshorea leprosula TaxID=152421 RepID=A0AAV5KC31_9ROSI|nr:hypothetical protein SLEP1_g32029 [Rubroshorea leprosula]